MSVYRDRRPKAFASRNADRNRMEAVMRQLRTLKPPPAFTFRFSGPGLAAVVERDGQELASTFFAVDYFLNPDYLEREVRSLVAAAIAKNRELAGLEGAPPT